MHIKLTSQTHTTARPHPAGMIPLTDADYIPMPAKAINHRGIVLTRSTLIRSIESGQIKSRLFRMPGSTKGRRYLLRESLDTFLDKHLVDVPLDHSAA